MRLDPIEKTPGASEWRRWVKERLGPAPLERVQDLSLALGSELASVLTGFSQPWCFRLSHPLSLEQHRSYNRQYMAQKRAEMKATEREFFEGLITDVVRGIGAATLAKCEADDASADVIAKAIDNHATAVTFAISELTEAVQRLTTAVQCHG